ncbi:MAG: creatininase family protein [Natronosporangium sp.]
MHLDPSLVRQGFAAADHDAPHRPHLLSLGMRSYTDTGVIGKPSLATAEKGKAVLDSLVDGFADYRSVLVPPVS